MIGELQVLVNTEVTVDDAHFKIGSEKKCKKMQFFEIFPLTKGGKSGNLMVYKVDNVYGVMSW